MPGQPQPTPRPGKLPTTVRGGKAARAARKQQQRHELANTTLRKGLAPSTFSGAAVWSGGMLGLLWAILIVNAVLDHRLLRFGIKPRQVDGLSGIIFSPFLHANAGHLVANSVPFAVLAWLLLISGVRYFVVVTAAGMLAAGLVDWLAGPSGSVIVGASGLIFCWLGYLLARAWFSRKLAWIAVAVAVALVFSSMFSGLLPRLGGNVFWGGHVSGFAVGVAVAYAFHRRPARPKPANGAPPFLTS
jgi:membrane associated rhomboid family serine protease